MCTKTAPVSVTQLIFHLRRLARLCSVPPENTQSLPMCALKSASSNVPLFKPTPPDYVFLFQQWIQLYYFGFSDTQPWFPFLTEVIKQEFNWCGNAKGRGRVGRQRWASFERYIWSRHRKRWSGEEWEISEKRQNELFQIVNARWSSGQKISGGCIKLLFFPLSAPLSICRLRLISVLLEV